jgi:hypothetical protein
MTTPSTPVAPFALLCRLWTCLVFKMTSPPTPFAPVAPAAPVASVALVASVTPAVLVAPTVAGECERGRLS